MINVVFFGRVGGGVKPDGLACSALSYRGFSAKADKWSEPGSAIDGKMCFSQRQGCINTLHESSFQEKQRG